VADLAGAITAAAFLSNFVGTTPWVHLDIAGTAYTAEDGTKVKTYTPKGATGVGVKLADKSAKRSGNLLHLKPYHFLAT
jgi:leucyl aminopeptidase